MAVTGGDNGTILTSPDGKVWTERWSKAGSYLYGVAYGNNTFVVVGWAGQILTSPDGVTWTEKGHGDGSRSLRGNLRQSDFRRCRVARGDLYLTRRHHLDWQVVRDR